MDGYALKFAAREKELHASAGKWLPDADHSFTLNEGETSRIFTGAPLARRSRHSGHAGKSNPS